MTWEQVGFAGWGDENNVGSWIDDNSIAIFNDRLFVGTLKNWYIEKTGGEVWLFLENSVFLPFISK